jgi:hypothetical protein
MSKKKPSYANMPGWALKHMEKCRRAFGFNNDTYQLYPEWVRSIDGNVQGEAETDHRYQRVTVRLRDDLVKSDTGYEVITHEMLHAGLSAERQAVFRIIDDLVPKKLREHALSLWCDGHEASVTQVARALSPLLQRAEWNAAETEHKK